jgi:hypothetical protein
MALEEGVISVFAAFLHLPEAHELMQDAQAGKSIPHDLFLKNAALAKELFSTEPGCKVNYQAIQERLKLLEPHLKVTPSGPALIAFFVGLRKYRNMWAIAFAKYESHAILTHLLETEIYGRNLEPDERLVARQQDVEWIALYYGVVAAEKKLKDIKASHEFARYVRILEECTKNHKIHLQRKAHAEKTRQDLAKKKAEARTAKKAKKAVSAVPVPTSNPERVQSTFNPDLPDFAQFMRR